MAQKIARNERPVPPPPRYSPVSARNGRRDQRAYNATGRHYSPSSNGRSGVRDYSREHWRYYDPNYYNRTYPAYNPGAYGAGGGSSIAHYSHIEQEVINLRNEVAEMKALHYKEISSLDEEQSMNARLRRVENFLAPLREEEEAVESGGRSRFLSLGCDDDDDDDDEMESLSEDVYSILFVAKTCSVSFFFTLVMTSFQFFISALIIIDLLENGEEPFDVESDNPFKLPAKVDFHVSCSQFAALIIAFVTEKEIITSAKMMLIGYDPDVQKISRGATYPKFLLSNFLRFATGLVTIFISVLIIMQSSEVLEIFMNFAAVAFISDLDNIAFETAKDGLLGRRLKRATERVEETKMKIKREDHVLLVNILFVLFFIPFFLGLTLVRLRQSNGFILAVTSCNGVFVQFGDEGYQIPAGINFEFVGEGYNKTFPNSTRELPLINETPPLLLYQYFTGRYVPEQQETRNDRLREHEARPVYWERGFNDPTSGKFYYCDKIKSWVFTIEAIYYTPGAIPSLAMEECEWGWLMQSPTTDARTLEEAPDKDWKVWTGRVVDLEDSTSFSIRCTDCERNIDCGLDNGVCIRETGECDCNEGWQGTSCHVPDPYCPNLGWINYGESAYDYYESRKYVLLTDGNGKPLEFYDRPVYGMLEFDQYYNYSLEIILYTGRRWFDTFWDIQNLDVVDDGFHGYWDNTFDLTTRRYSEPTDSILPTGFEWNEIQSSRSAGSFGFFGFSLPLHARFECLHVDCAERPSICGEYGDCVWGTEWFPNFTYVGYITERYNCECVEGFGGFYCEHEPFGLYAAEFYAEYGENTTLFAENYPDLENQTNLTYLKFLGAER